MKSKEYYSARAAYMRSLAQTAQTEALRQSCLKSAAAYEQLAKEADIPKTDEKAE